MCGGGSGCVGGSGVCVCCQFNCNVALRCAALLFNIDGDNDDDGDGDVARYATLLFARLVSCPRQACPVCISLTRPVGNAVYRPPELVRRYLFQQLFQAEVFSGTFILLFGLI